MKELINVFHRTNNHYARSETRKGNINKCPLILAHSWNSEDESNEAYIFICVNDYVMENNYKLQYDIA